MLIFFKEITLIPPVLWFHLYFY